ncbi:MAG TPA: LysR family transcriptional regulator [Symbiobacteriaceae bacterium]|nr:LysR family transcriptional regulator [Symbiobacteriaceae bacterium]
MKHLQTFVVAARTLNFRKAAEQLFLAQPTVTQHVHLLETELRVLLFDRSAKKVRLTPAGERFLQYAERMLGVYEQGVQELTGWQQGYRDRLVLVVSPLVARSTLPRVIKRFMASHADVEVVVHIAMSPEIPAQVAEGRAHLGLSRMPSMSRDLHSYVWYKDPVILVLPSDGHDHEHAPPDWREELTHHRLFTHNHPVYWDDLLVSIHRAGVRVRTMEVGLVDITKRFIEEGLGISFLPESTVRRELMEGRLMEVPTPGLPLPVGATYVIHPAQGPSATAQAFMEELTPPPRKG